MSSSASASSCNSNAPLTSTGKYYDKSDRKAMDLLISNLTKQKEEHLKSVTKENKGTTKKNWYKKRAPATSKKQKRPKTVTTEDKKHPCDGEQSKNTTKLQKLTAQQSELFKRYGIIIPTCDEILKNAENLSVCKDLLNQCNTDDVYVPKKMKLTRSKKPHKKLDCKHLSPDDLTDCFKKYTKYIKGVFRGDIFSERHRVFHDRTASNDLTCSASTYVFAYTQKKHLIILLQKLFGDDYNEQYAFKVLLPELCFKIFMDEHDMNYDESVAYFNNMPMDA